MCAGPGPFPDLVRQPDDGSRAAREAGAETHAETRLVATTGDPRKKAEPFDLGSSRRPPGSVVFYTRVQLAGIGFETPIRW